MRWLLWGLWEESSNWQGTDLKITDIYRGILPFLIAPLILIVMLFMAPEMALWLPGVLYN